MKNAILMHGRPDKEEWDDPDFPSCSNYAWLPWLQKQLIVKGIAAHTPEVPEAWKPAYPLWQKEFERYELTPETLLVGHSCGGGFIVRWLSEHKDVSVGKVVLVAPSLGLDWEDKSFFDFEIAPGLAARTKELVIFVSDDDRPGIQQAVKVLQSTIKGVRIRQFSGYGHFTHDTQVAVRFPELAEELLS